METGGTLTQRSKNAKPSRPPATSRAHTANAALVVLVMLLCVVAIRSLKQVYLEAHPNDMAKATPSALTPDPNEGSTAIPYPDRVARTFTVPPREQSATPKISGEAYKNLHERLVATIQSQDLEALRGLYSLSGVSAEEWKAELARWAPIFRPVGPSRAQIAVRQVMFRDFELSNPIHQERAQRRSSHKATHLAQLWCWADSGAQWWIELPLVASGDSLLILPSDKLESTFGPDIPKSKRP